MSKIKAAIYATLTIILILAIVTFYCICPNLTLVVVVGGGIICYIWYVVYTNYSMFHTKKEEE